MFERSAMFRSEIFGGTRDRIRGRIQESVKDIHLIDFHVENFPFAGTIYRMVEGVKTKWYQEQYRV